MTPAGHIGDCGNQDRTALDREDQEKGEPEKLNGSVAEPDFFRVLGVQPVLGRFYGKQDNRTGGPRVAVLGFDYWKRRYPGEDMESDEIPKVSQLIEDWEKQFQAQHLSKLRKIHDAIEALCRDW